MILLKLMGDFWWSGMEGKQLEAGDLKSRNWLKEMKEADVVGMRLDDVVKKLKGHKGNRS